MKRRYKNIIGITLIAAGTILMVISAVCLFLRLLPIGFSLLVIGLCITN